MTAIAHALARFRRRPSPPEASTSHPVKLVSTLDGPAGANEVGDAWHGHGLPSEALDLWAACRRARLFEDVDYGSGAWLFWHRRPARLGRRKRVRRGRPISGATTSCWASS
jgi:hypothetical protein